MKVKMLFLFLIMSFALIVMVGPASAEEVTITFDDGRLSAGQYVGSAYADLGVTFSSGTQVVDTQYGQGTDLGFYNPTSGVCTITFSPYVRSVSIDFTDSFVGRMDAILVNGKRVSDLELNAWFTENTLHLESRTENPIMSIRLSDGLLCKSIKFDNLRYSQIPEFPTVVLPVAAVIGVMLILQRRKN